MNIKIGYPEILMIAAVMSLGRTDNVNIFFLLASLSVITAFLKVCLQEKRIEDLKIISNPERYNDEQ